MRSRLLGLALAGGLLLPAPALASQGAPESVRPVLPPEVAAAVGYDRVGSSFSLLRFVAGTNADVDATEEAIWTTGGAYAFLTAADELRVKSGGNAADIYGGNGAQEIVLEGLDSSWNRISAVIQLAGTAASAKTSATFFRLNRAYVRLGGTYTASNTAAITIETEAGTTIAVIPAEAGTTEGSMAVYSVPNGYVGYIVGYGFTNSVTTSTVQMLASRQYGDDVATPYGSERLLISDSAVAKTASWYYDLNTPIRVGPKSDVWVAVSGPTNDIATAYFEIYVVPEAAVPTPTPMPSPTPTPTPTP